MIYLHFVAAAREQIADAGRLRALQTTEGTFKNVRVNFQACSFCKLTY